MLQIIFAIIGLTTAASIGFVIIQQIATQTIIQDQRENSRRLDVAAVALEGALGRLPGVDAVLAPAPGSTPGVA